MRDDNENITIPGMEALVALREIEYILISLHRIASHYYAHAESVVSDKTYIEYALETTRFIDSNHITQRLASSRMIISSKFNRDVGSDDMDDIERDFLNIKYWEKPGD